MSGFHLAQLNIGRLRAPIDDPVIAEFAAALDPVNALADRSPGFVWRLQDDSGNATGVRPFDDDSILVNMSVWESLEDLRAFVYRSDHRRYLNRRREWFEKMDELILVLWWVPVGHVPTMAEAKERLERVQAQGPSPEAFTFRRSFPAPDSLVRTPRPAHPGRSQRDRPRVPIMTVIAVEKPESLGIDVGRLDALRSRARREIDSGLLPSCQFALARHGKLAAFDALGNADLPSRYAIFSSTKAFVASVVWQLMAEGKIDIERRVAEYIPEFGTNGKDVITVEQVLLHTSGFPHAPLGPPKWNDRAERVAQFGRWRLNWEPGTAYEYHATSAHWVLAELIDRVTGGDYRDELHERVTRPLGLPRILGIDPDDQDDVTDVEVVGEPPTADELEAALGIRELPTTEVTDEALLMIGTPENRAVGVPGGGGIATAATVALFYQALLHNHSQLWDPELLADATGRVRNSFPDPLVGVPINRGLGVVIAGDDGRASLRGFGHTQGPRTFGHNGAYGQIAWADPDSGLSFCYVTNGGDRHTLRQARRSIGLSSRAAVCTT